MRAGAADVISKQNNFKQNIVDKTNVINYYGFNQSNRFQGGYILDHNLKESQRLLYLDSIEKSFSDNRVLKGVTLSLHQGQITAMIGGNGAGKSTLMKIIMGIYFPDKGSVYIGNEEIKTFKPSNALDLGVYLVPQEPMLFPNMTAEENILIGLPGDRKANKKKLEQIITDLGWKIALGRNAELLSIADQQLIEILRGLLREAKVLILDEPTSSLTFKEIKTLFSMVERLKNQGIGIIYITHRLDEVFELATDVVILKDGRITSEGKVSEYTKKDLIRNLLPQNVEVDSSGEIEMKEAEPAEVEQGKVVLEVSNLTGYGFTDISLQLHEGEVLGIAGVVGAGRTELAEAIFGIEPVISGKVYLDGKDITGLSTKEVVDLGLNYVPEDRHANGIFKITSVVENITAASMSYVSKFFTKRKKEVDVAQKYIDDFRIKVTDEEQILGSLSGGNQQKCVIAKVLASNPKVIILDEPTRGIDAAARADVYKIVSKLKEEGLAVLMISSDLEEIVSLCDRTLTMYSGSINAEMCREEMNLDSIMAASFNVLTKEVGR